MDKNLVTILKILIPLYGVLAALFALLVAYQKRENDANNYCMNYIYKELGNLDRRIDLIVYPTEN